MSKSGKESKMERRAEKKIVISLTCLDMNWNIDVEGDKFNWIYEVTSSLLFVLKTK